MHNFSHMEDAQTGFIIYVYLTMPRYPETRPTFGCGVTWTGSMADGSYFSSVSMFILTFLEVGILTKRVLANLVLGTGLEIATCMLLL